MLVYKPPGILGTNVANQYKEKLNKKKVCICGKLDPMAEGQLLLLFDHSSTGMGTDTGTGRVRSTGRWG